MMAGKYSDNNRIFQLQYKVIYIKNIKNQNTLNSASRAWPSIKKQKSVAPVATIKYCVRKKYG